MGRFKRLSIEEASKEFPLLNEEAKKALKGGCWYHEFFGVERTSPDELLRILDKNGDGDKNGKLWVCDLGLVEITEHTSTVLISQDQFQVCHMHNYLFYSSGTCYACTPFGSDSQYCNGHGRYFDGSVCPECTPEYCTNHQMFFTAYNPCGGCAEDKFNSMYPNGCFEHRQPEYCACQQKP